MKNQKGFGLIGFLVLLPFLMSVLATIAGAALLFKADSHLRHECRVSVLNSQRSVAEKLRALIKLNPRATALRAEYAQAQELLRLAMTEPNPAAIAVAEANLARVQLSRSLLMAQQKALIVSARAMSFSAPLKARGAVLQSLGREATDNRVRAPSTRRSSRFGRFDVRASPEGDLTPDYNPSSRFTESQVVDVDVQAELGPLLPDWLRKLLPTEGLTVSSHCQATIEKKENTWVETLNAVK